MSPADEQFIIDHIARLPQFGTYEGRRAFIQSTGLFSVIQLSVNLQGTPLEAATNFVLSVVNRDEPEGFQQLLSTLAHQYGETSPARQHIDDIARAMRQQVLRVGAAVEWSGTETPEYIQEKFYGSPLYPVNFLQRGFQRARAVSLIQLGSILGTGVLIEESLLLTCKHVVPSAQAAESAQFVFNYEERGAAAAPYTWNGPGSYWHSDAHDIAIIELAGTPGKTWGTVPISATIPQAEEYIHLIHHALGTYKRVSLGAAVRFVQPGTLGYLATTMPGSSGAPVFNDAWELVAIHRGSEHIKRGYQMYSHNAGTPIPAFRETLPAPWRKRLTVQG